jgi:hypothetical protein
MTPRVRTRDSFLRTRDPNVKRQTSASRREGSPGSGPASLSAKPPSRTRRRSPSARKARLVGERFRHQALLGSHDRNGDHTITRIGVGGRLLGHERDRLPAP